VNFLGRGRNMVFRKMRYGWVQFHIEISKVTRSNFTRLVSPNAGRIVVDSPILNISIPSEDIRRRTLKSIEIGPNFACFWPLKFLRRLPPKENLDQGYKIERSSEHRAKFRSDRPTKLGDYARGKNNNKFQQNISPPENYRFRAE